MTAIMHIAPHLAKCSMVAHVVMSKGRYFHHDKENNILLQWITVSGQGGLRAAMSPPERAIGGFDVAGKALGVHQRRCCQPRPQFSPQFGEPGQVIRERHGRIAFGHSELSGRQSWGRAAQESRRALKQVIELV